MEVGPLPPTGSGRLESAEMRVRVCEGERGLWGRLAGAGQWAPGSRVGRGPVRGGLRGRDGGTGVPACRELRIRPGHWRRPFRSGDFGRGSPGVSHLECVPALKRRGNVFHGGRNRAVDLAIEVACNHAGLQLVGVPDSVGTAGLRGFVRVSCLLGTVEPPLAEVGQKSG